ncbi:hypothetical protein SAMN05661091_4158 [Paenibacillus uliginis N3/975]|uniref:Uncharacterized protein n=1 Tax=Paenibacillus uliginis N3/975 TaxID=1313296 RepID=A0A1X7HK53_9BACL|nr:hypothetical protein SAMN05661091_4158 [Paenibacillus uliginis N3/975]
MTRIRDLKIEALNIHHEIQTQRKGFIQRIRLKRKLKILLNEIEYQEGRRQYANRPYSKPVIVQPPARYESEAHTFGCQCGCWLETLESFGVKKG